MTDKNMENTGSQGGVGEKKSGISTAIVLSPEIVKAWQGIKHFQMAEFDSPDLPLSGSLMNLEFVKLLDTLREKCGFPFHINSGFRSSEHNAQVGGVDASAHEEGVAVDIAVAGGQERMKIVKEALALGIKRIGVGKNLIHLDMSYSLPQDVLWAYGNK